MHYHWYIYCEWLTSIGVAAFSAVRGAPAERYGAALILVINVISDLAMAIVSPHVPQMVLFWLDFLLALGLLLITFRYSSLWLGGAMLLQSLMLFMHAMALGGDELSSYAFMYVNNGVSWLMYLCLFGATLMSWHSTRRARRAKKPAVTNSDLRPV
jgi:hypothetical protein